MGDTGRAPCHEEKNGKGGKSGSRVLVESDGENTLSRSKLTRHVEIASGLGAFSHDAAVDLSQGSI